MWFTWWHMLSTQNSTIQAILGNFIVSNKWTVLVIIVIKKCWFLWCGPIDQNVWMDIVTHRDGEWGPKGLFVCFYIFVNVNPNNIKFPS